MTSTERQRTAARAARRRGEMNRAGGDRRVGQTIKARRELATRPDESPYAAAVRALLEDGPLQGKTVEVEAVEGRPPRTIDVPDERGGACRYCLAQWTQEGMTAAYTFLYAV